MLVCSLHWRYLQGHEGTRQIGSGVDPKPTTAALQKRGLTVKREINKQKATTTTASIKKPLQKPHPKVSSLKDQR